MKIFQEVVGFPCVNPTYESTNLRISDRFKFYRSVPDFKEYILIDQYRYYVEQFYQQNNGEWLFKAFESENDDLRLYSVDFQISLLDIYQRIDFTLTEE